MRNEKHKPWCGCWLDPACGDGCSHCTCQQPQGLRFIAKKIVKQLRSKTANNKVGTHV